MQHTRAFDASDVSEQSSGWGGINYYWPFLNKLLFEAIFELKRKQRLQNASYPVLERDLCYDKICTNHAFKARATRPCFLATEHPNIECTIFVYWFLTITVANNYAAGMIPLRNKPIGEWGSYGTGGLFWRIYKFFHDIFLLLLL